MLVVLQAGEAVGYIIVVALVAVVLVVPITVTLRHNRRTFTAQAEAARASHMGHWVPPSAVSFTARGYDGPRALSETPGPRIVAADPEQPSRWVRVVNAPAPTRPEHVAQGLVSDPLEVLHTGVTELQGADTAARRGETAAGRPAGGDGDGPVPARSGAGGAARRFSPPARPDIAAGTAEAMVLGAPVLTPLASQPERRIATELGCYLALHNERKMKRDEVMEALWPGDLYSNSASPGTLRNAMWMLRQCLGDALVPDATGGLYRLSEKVTTDWRRFCDLVAGPENEGEIDALTSALVLVRGVPFDGVPDGTYTWATTEMLTSDMENAIRSAAGRLARITFAAGSFDHARFAAEKGLVVSPYDRELWAVLLEVAAQGGTAEMERTYDRARANLGSGISVLDDVAARLRARS